MDGPNVTRQLPPPEQSPPDRRLVPVSELHALVLPLIPEARELLDHIVSNRRTAVIELSRFPSLPGALLEGQGESDGPFLTVSNIDATGSFYAVLSFALNPAAPSLLIADRDGGTGSCGLVRQSALASTLEPGALTQLCTWYSENIELPVQVPGRTIPTSTPELQLAGFINHCHDQYPTLGLPVATDGSKRLAWYQDRSGNPDPAELGLRSKISSLPAQGSLASPFNLRQDGLLALSPEQVLVIASANEPKILAQLITGGVLPNTEHLANQTRDIRFVLPSLQRALEEMRAVTRNGKIFWSEESIEAMYQSKLKFLAEHYLSAEDMTQFPKSAADLRAITTFPKSRSIDATEFPLITPAMVKEGISRYPEDYRLGR